MATQLCPTAASIWHFCQRLEFFADHQPIHLAALDASSTNDNFLIHTDRGHFVLRHYAPAVAGVCRQQELRCQHAAAAAGLAPAPLCLNNHQRVLISEFIHDAIPWRWPEHQAHVPQLIGHLARLHQLDVQTPWLDPQLYLYHLRQQAIAQSLSPATVEGASQAEPLPHTEHSNPAVTPLLKSSASGMASPSRLMTVAGSNSGQTACDSRHWSVADEQRFAALMQVCHAFAALPSDAVLCHLDVHSGNILLQQQRLWLIDFEYCQQADSSLDLAALCVEWQLDAGQQQQLLAMYLTIRPKSLALAERLALAKIIYAGFCWLWCQVMQSAQLPMSRQRVDDYLRGHQ